MTSGEMKRYSVTYAFGALIASIRAHSQHMNKSCAWKYPKTLEYFQRNNNRECDVASVLLTSSFLIGFVVFAFFSLFFSFPFSMNKLAITRIILLPMPHRQRQSMVAVIIVFINRCHSILEVLPKSKYYLSPIYFFSLFSIRWLLFFISFIFSFFSLCFVVLLCVSCLSFDFWGFFGSVYIVDFVCECFSFSCLPYYDSSVTDLWKTLSITKLFSFRFCFIWFLVDYQQIHEPFEWTK